MLNKSDIPKIIKTGVILLLITGVAALILAFVNSLTKPIIEKNAALKQETAMKTVMSEVDEFSPIELEGIELPAEISEAYSAKRGNDTVGYVLIANPNGYGGKISMVIGVDTDEKVTGVDITSQTETAGLGANCTKDDFKNQFIGKSGELQVVKGGQASGDSQVDAITSATITSKAVTKGVNAAISAANALKEAGK